jgi:hypothetical protein
VTARVIVVTAQSPPVKNAPTDTVFLAMVNPVNNVIRVHHVLIVPNAEIDQTTEIARSVENVLLSLIVLNAVTVLHMVIVLKGEIAPLMVTVLLMGIDPNVLNDPAMEIVQIVLETQTEILHALRGPIDLLLIDQHTGIAGIEMVVPIVEATPAVDLRVPLAVSVLVTTGDNDLPTEIDPLDQNALEGQKDQTGHSVKTDMTVVIVPSAVGDMTAMPDQSARTARHIVIMTAPLLDIQEDRATGMNVLVLRNANSQNKSY